MSNLATIIITYNGSKWIRKCLEHLYDSSVTSHIIIVDNNSTDNTIEVLEPFLEKIELIQLPTNLGFGGANNIGIKRAIESGYSHFFLLNQDAYVQKDCISKLLDSAKSYPDYGIISPIQLNSREEDMDSVFYDQIKKYYDPGKLDLFKAFNNEKIEEPVAVRFVGAAAWFISLDLIKKVGFFHPVFFHYGEDNNYAARAQFFGFKIGIQVATAMIHDRKPRVKSQFLSIKLRSFPLHQLLDIRKPFLVGWIVGFYQLLRTWKKLKKISGEKHKDIFFENRKWFFTYLRKASEIRKTMKQIYDYGQV
ncbi:MAG: glycosyltransferase family 2 protein [Cecembia sp.]